MNKYIILSIILFVILYYLYNLYDRASFIVENFEDLYGQNEEYKDIYDKEFVNFYDIIYKDEKNEDEIMKYVNKELKNFKEPNILVVGCGRGSLLNKLKKQYKNSQGLDKSENMLKKCQENYPYIKTIKADISREKLFENSKYDMILFDEDTLYQNNKKKIERIIKNIRPYLSKEGILFMPIYEEKELDPSPRYYTTNYYDNERNKHGFTYINNFAHNCYYIKKENDKSGYNYDYYDKIVLKDGNYRIKKTKLYIPEKEDQYELFLHNGYNVKKIYQLNDFSENKYEIGIFKKGINKINVEKNDNNINN